MNLQEIIKTKLQNEKTAKLLQLLSVLFLIALAIFIFSNSFSFLFTPKRDQYDKYDPVAKDYLNTYKGAVTGLEGFVNLHFLEEVQKSGMQIDSYSKMHNILEYFFTYSYPDFKSLSLQKGSLKKEENDFSFTLVSDSEQKFNIIATVPKANQLNLEIKSHNNLIYFYKHDFYDHIYDNKNLIDKLLPKKLKLQNQKQLVVRKNILKNRYEIMITSCGDKAQNQEARKVVADWLETINLDKKDFNFVIPKSCDGENTHNHDHHDHEE